MSPSVGGGVELDDDGILDDLEDVGGRSVSAIPVGFNVADFPRSTPFFFPMGTFTSVLR